MRNNKTYSRVRDTRFDPEAIPVKRRIAVEQATTPKRQPTNWAKAYEDHMDDYDEREEFFSP